MNKTNIFILVIVVLLALSVIYFLVNKNPVSVPVPINNNVDTSTTTSTTKPTTPSAVPKAPHSVIIQNFAFSQSSITIKKGDNVVWINKDSASHIITSDTGDFNSQTLTTNDSYNHDFNTIGVFNYHCAIHPSMKGKITVTE